MQVSFADEAPEVMIPEEDVKDHDPLEPPETATEATSENDIIILEESTVASPAFVPTTSPPETDSECRS